VIAARVATIRRMLILLIAATMREDEVDRACAALWDAL
jgi:hypothetical protein